MRHRRWNNYSREEVAAILGVTRQTITKWESNESSPDLEHAAELARLFKVSLDELVKKEKAPPEKKQREYDLWGTVKVRSKGSVTIPKKILDLFDIHWGDELIVMTDLEQGIELMPKEMVIEKILENSNNYQKTS